MTDQKHWLDKTLGTLKRAGEAAKEGVQRTYQVSTLKIEIASLRRTLEDVVRDVGRSAVAALRERGSLVPGDVAPLLRRVDELEDQIAGKERLIADLEREDTARPPSADDAGDPNDATQPSRRKPDFAPKGPTGA